MKKFTTIIILVCLIIASCEDFLKEEYISGENSATITKSEAGMESLVAASYIFLKVWYGKENQWDLTESGTDLYTRGLDCRSAGFCTYSGLVGEEQNRMAAMWYELYKALNSCNLAIRDIENAPYNDSEIKKARKGELLFLRAHYLWLIVENWGPVHFVLEPVEEAVYTANKTPIATFYGRIFKDLEEALDNIPETTPDYGRVTEPVVKAFLARVHLMWESYQKNRMKICMKDYIDKDGSQQSHYEAALKYSKELIENYDYKLISDWTKIWNIDNIKNEEIIWIVNYSKNATFTTTNLINRWDTDYPDFNPAEDPLTDILYNASYAIQRDGGHQGHLMYEIRYENLSWGIVRDLNNGRGFQRWMPTKKLLELYNEAKDQRFYGSFKNVWYCNQAEASIPKWKPFVYVNGEKVIIPKEKWAKPMFQAGDTCVYFSKTPVPANLKAKFTPNDLYSFHPEKGYLIFDINDMYLADGKPNDGIISRQFYFPITKKYMDTTRIDVSTQYSKRDAYVIRLSEMYLIASEAALETGNNSLAYEYLLQLANNRAYNGNGADLLSSYKEFPINTGNDINIDFLLDERARELTTEGLRFWDLKRTGKLIERVKAFNTDAAPNIGEHHQLRFIPQTQLDAVKNKEEFTQNPGY